MKTYKFIILQLARLIFLIPIALTGGYFFSLPFTISYEMYNAELTASYKALLLLIGGWYYYDKYFYDLLPILITLIIGAILSGQIFLRITKIKPSDSNVGSQKYGYAKFCSFRKIWKIGFSSKEGIILGKKLGKLIRMKDPLSILVLAPPGTGKTAGIIIPTLLTLKNSVMVYDLKGNLFTKTSKTRAKFSKIYFFDPVSDNSCVFNPLAKEMLPRDSRDVRGYILNIASILFKSPGDRNEYFFGAAKSAFVFFAEWLIWQNNETSFGEIRDQLLDNPDVISTIKKMIEDPHLPQEIVKDGHGVLISEAAEEQWAGVVGVFKETIEIFADERVRKATTGSCDFTGDIARKSLISVYINVQDIDSERLGPLMTLLFECVGTQLLSQLPQEEDNRVTFVLDEFVRLGKMEKVKKLPEISREYNVNAIFMAQDYEQIASIYGNSAMSIFETTCATKVIFCQNSKNTAKNISETIGNKTDIRKSKSQGNNSGKSSTNKSRSKSESLEGTPLITAQDILNMDRNNCIILIQGHLAEPIKANIVYYFKDRKFKKLLGEVDKNDLEYKSTEIKAKTTTISKPYFDDADVDQNIVQNFSLSQKVMKSEEQIILDIIKAESQKGNLYIPRIFAEIFEDKRGLKSKSSISNRISLLATSGKILFSRDWNKYSLEKATTNWGLMLVSDMNYIDKDGNEIEVIATHFKHPTTGNLTVISNDDAIEEDNDIKDSIDEILMGLDTAVIDQNMEDIKEGNEDKHEPLKIEPETIDLTQDSGNIYEELPSGKEEDDDGVVGI